MKYQFLNCISYQMMLMFTVSILTIVSIKPSTFGIYLTLTSFYTDFDENYNFSLINYRMMLVLTVSLLIILFIENISLLIILFIENSTFGIYSVLNPKCLISQKLIIVG